MLRFIPYITCDTHNLTNVSIIMNIAYQNNSPPSTKMKNMQLIVSQMKLLTERLSKLSPDSIWARRASGVRGALLKLLPELEAVLKDDEPVEGSLYTDLEKVEYLLDRGYEFLERAAQEY